MKMLEALVIFAENLRIKSALLGSSSPEDQLKPLVADLLKTAGRSFDMSVETRTETHLPNHRARPDTAFYTGGLICGYVELNAPKLKGAHNKAQWEKLKGLPNLILHGRAGMGALPCWRTPKRPPDRAAPRRFGRKGQGGGERGGVPRSRRRYGYRLVAARPASLQ